jgi:preprotein translocase subunit YajC
MSWSSIMLKLLIPVWLYAQVSYLWIPQTTKAQKENEHLKNLRIAE